MDNVDYVIYTDGSCRGNGKTGAYGGWAFIVLRNNEIVLKGSAGEVNTTNQRMELTAALMACRTLSELDGSFKAQLYSDSAYLINCKKQEWYKNWQKNGWKNSRKEPVANADLWARLIEYFDSGEFDFIKVKGHCGIEYNELVDRMAVSAAEEVKNDRSSNTGL